MRICPTCGEENADRARFCQNCATPLTETERPSEVRKVVTIVFADVTGSTALGERLDPEAMRRVMGRYFDEMSAVIERHGGTVEKFIGDAVMAVFGIPQLHEDDALRAVRAADGMRTALETLNDDLERDHGVGLTARIGVNTGEVVAGDPSGGQRLVTGDAVNVAARLEQAAAPGEILLGESTYRLVKDAVEVTPVEPLDLKGKAEPVRASRLDVVLEDTAGHARHLDSAMVGRHKELEMLDRALDRVVTERTSHLFTLLGSAGVGKSRLVWEFVAGPGTEATVLRGRCLSYGEGITYFPLVEIVQEAAGVGRTDDLATARSKLATLAEGAEDRDRIVSLVAGLLSWGEPVAAEDGQWGVRKLLEHLAHERPLVVRVRRHPLGGAQLPRAGRAPRGLDARCAAPAPVRRAARAPRAPPGLGRREDERHLDPAGAARGRRGLPPGRQPARPGGHPRRRPSQDPRGRRGQPAVRRGDARHADRRRAPAVRGRCVARGRGSRARHRAADDPALARRPSGPAGRRGTRRDRTRGGRGQGLPRGRRDHADARDGSARRCPRDCWPSLARS